MIRRKMEARRRGGEGDSEVRKLKREVRALRRSMGGRRDPRGRGRWAGRVLDDDGLGSCTSSRGSGSSSSSDGRSLEGFVGSEGVRKGNKGRKKKGKGNAKGEGKRDPFTSKVGAGSEGPGRGFEPRGDLPEIRYRYVPPRVPSPPPPPRPVLPPFIPIAQPRMMNTPAPDQDQDQAPYHTRTHHTHHRNHPRHHRQTSLPPPQPPPPTETTTHVHTHTTKAALLAGALEGIHVATTKGDWIGPKGMRVGTAMAAAAGTSYVRGKREEAEVDDGGGTAGMMMGSREMVVDVGAGLLVSRLLYGSTRSSR